VLSLSLIKPSSSLFSLLSSLLSSLFSLLSSLFSLFSLFSLLFREVHGDTAVHLAVESSSIVPRIACPSPSSLRFSLLFRRLHISFGFHPKDVLSPLCSPLCSSLCSSLRARGEERERREEREERRERRERREKRERERKENTIRESLGIR